MCDCFQRDYMKSGTGQRHLWLNINRSCTNLNYLHVAWWAEQLLLTRGVVGVVVVWFCFSVACVGCAAAGSAAACAAAAAPSGPRCRLSPACRVASASRRCSFALTASPKGVGLSSKAKMSLARGAGTRLMGRSWEVWEDGMLHGASLCVYMKCRNKHSQVSMLIGNPE